MQIITEFDLVSFIKNAGNFEILIIVLVASMIYISLMAVWYSRISSDPNYRDEIEIVQVPTSRVYFEIEEINELKSKQD
ncbi:hypothetical protein [Carp edema virus]|nr:hypothetical protein [Carp edema virus]